ncbi:unnamed protein product [Rhodiola kirilowii]
MDIRQMRREAVNYYNGATRQVQNLVYQFFRSMDTNGDGGVWTFTKFKAFFERAAEHLTCVTCFTVNQTGNTYDICGSCYAGGYFRHEHGHLVDYYTLILDGAANHNQPHGSYLPTGSQSARGTRGAPSNHTHSVSRTGKIFEAAVAYKKKIGFNGTLLIEPKPQEHYQHQYDWDAATSANFLRKYGLIDEFKLNIECNHATLSGHSCHHELETARINGLLGNIDANTGDPQVGWDTDEFLTDIGEATKVMLSVGGLAPGGFNFDAKLLTKESTDVEDLFIAHISGMDTLARGLRNVAKLIEEGSLDELVRKRYQSFDSELGAEIEAGKVDFELLEKKALEWESRKSHRRSRYEELAEMIFQSAL